MADYSALLAAFIGASSAIGANFLHHFFNRIVANGERKESQRDSDLKRIENVVEETRALAVEYWSLPGEGLDQEKRVAAINGRMGFLFGIVEALFGNDPIQSDYVGNYLTNFHEACTSGDYQVRSRLPDTPRISEIEVKAFQFLHSAEKCRRQLKRAWLG
ncbi:hypothetical protein [Pseudorhodobacter wandonensis]|uniref:hypothetical protein n=1 Tax=Pseudorhodobacter wandonensis TaxID=1120568 RepID=UPI00067D8E3F|nr:hypothetical protein [Pseudorhodobacter wandonensis]